MEKILFLDAGNTRMKAAVLQRNARERKKSSRLQGDSSDWLLCRTPEYEAADFNDRLRDLCRPYDRIVLASVKKRLQPDRLKDILTGDFPEILSIKQSDLTPDKHRYRTPETLGIDRYLACLGAWGLSGTPVIVSDVGTACTVDVMDADGIYHGGVIMPGIHMLINSLGHGADGLFTVAPEPPATWPPDSTEAALRAGTTGTFIAAWQAHVQRSQSLYPDARIWLTGGDAALLMHHIRQPYRFHEHLVFEGMREWLNN